MQHRLRPDLSALPQTFLVSGVWLLALALTAWIAAAWYWHLNGASVQSARPAPVADPIQAAQDIASRQLFGTAAAISAPIVIAAPPPNLVLMGVSTRWGKLPGYAVIKDGASPASSFIEGEEISAGIKLVRVTADAIEINRNGVREQINLNAGPRSAGDATQYRPNTLPNAPPNAAPNNQPANASAPAADN